MSRIEKCWIATKIFIVVAAFITLTIIDFREMSRQGQPVEAGPMNIETRLHIGDPCDCSVQGLKILIDQGSGYCLDGVAVTEDVYEKFSMDLAFQYTTCPDPRRVDGGK